MNYQLIALLAVFGAVAFLFFMELIQFSITLIPKRKCIVYDFNAYKNTRTVRKYKI